MVYFFKVGNKELFKIGKTANTPEKRLKAVSTGSSYSLEIYKIIEHKSYSKLEVFFHKYFKKDRAENGEFFYIPVKDFDTRVDDALDKFQKLQKDLKIIDEFKNIKNNDISIKSTNHTKSIHSKILKITNTISELKEQQEELENELRIIIGKNEGIQDIATWRTQIREIFNKAKYEKEHPQECLKYIQTKSSRVLRIK